MKDEITIGLNGKTIASFGIDVFKGITPIGVKSVSGFKTSSGVRDNGESVLEIGLICVLEKNCPADYVEKKVTPIEPMIVQPIVMEKKVSVDEWAGSLNPDKLSTPVQQQMEAISAPTCNEIPIKTRKPRGPNKPKEDIAKVAEEIEKKGEFVPLEEAAKELKIAPVATPPVVEEKKVPAVPAPTTSARIAELGKLIKMWSKASGLGIDYVTVERLKAEAFDIVENDSDETIVAGIGEAKRLMSA